MKQKKFRLYTRQLLSLEKQMGLMLILVIGCPKLLIFAAANEIEELAVMAIVGAIVLFVALLIFMFATRKLVINFEQNTVSVGIWYLGIFIRKKYLLDHYDQLLLTTDASQLVGEVSRDKLNPKKNDHYVELSSDLFEDSVLIHRGSGNLAIKIAIEISKNCPNIATYKDQLKAGSKFDFSKLKKR